MSNAPSPVVMRVALGVSVLLVAAGFGAFWWASHVARQAPAPTGDQQVTVTIQGNTCQPNEITVPAGKTVFNIVNQSNRALEWEILDGVMVVEERENIAPGFTQTMTVKLQPGDFDITCGLLSNPRGKLHVTPSAASQAEAARPSLTAYVGALAEYRVFLVTEAGTLQDASQALADAIKAGDLAKARAAFPAAQQSYKRIEPMADLFADLDTRLDARPEYFEKREADPAFRGFYRVASALFGANAAQGDVHALAPVADELLTDVDALAKRINTLQVPPERLASADARLLGRIADHLQTGEDAYAAVELSNLQGTLDGSKKIIDLLDPLLAKSSPPTKALVDRAFTATSTALDPYRDGDGFKPAPLTSDQRKALGGNVRGLADAMAKVNAGLGLE
ncbi:iron uptake system protein EfeO [Luteibacter aegosomaticola]|uniref:iron uptake system protein EfeO n=1 Tax=Luteibacter aegosomaticola TaxID=2911538 RepID=UPI001FFBE1C6|nr:iron uptake system protein EfeO [Luteibacter aegosomaticola]UPG89989.1 iron uptake system protein EfeO [Luteibacter aegosomaticola]